MKKSKFMTQLTKLRTEAEKDFYLDLETFNGTHSFMGILISA